MASVANLHLLKGKERARALEKLGREPDEPKPEPKPEPKSKKEFKR